MSKNVTVDPRSPASPVDGPEIVEIMDCETGKYLKVSILVRSHTYDKFIELRGQVRERLHTENCKFHCAECGTPAYIVASKHKRFFFRHVKEDGSCSASTRGSLSQDEIRARKYHGQRESEAHKRIKSLIERSLDADAAFHTIQQEKMWRAARDPKAWRQPDVQAQSNGKRFAFEAQLSTTFLDVVVERKLFYKEESALLIWVMGTFSPEYRRLTTDDLLFSNNSNILVVDEETTRVSEDRRAFYIRCHFRRPVRDGDTLMDEWVEQIVRFRDLTCDFDKQRAFFFDFEGEEKQLQEIMKAELEGRHQQADDTLRTEFLTLWMEEPRLTVGPEASARWDGLKAVFASRGIEISPDNWSFQGMMNGLLSAKFGRPVGWNFTKLIEVAHCLADRYPEHLIAFHYALKHFDALDNLGREKLLQEQDKSGKWARRKVEIREKLKASDSKYIPDKIFLPALMFLFPEVGRSVQEFLSRITSD
jgi:hypothetical protein